MKTLVVYYSRTNITKKVAEIIAKELGADIEVLVDKKDRSGAKGYMVAGHDALFKKLTDIGEIKHNPGAYDLVIIGTPVWVGTMASAVRTYIENNKDKFKRVAFFATQGASRRQKVFDDLKNLTGKGELAELQLTTKSVVQDTFSEEMEEFIKELSVYKK